MSRKSVVLWLAAIALALAGAAPAGATVRTATFSWSPASGPVAGYVVYVSVDGDAEQFYSYAYQPSAVIQVESGASLIVRVAAFDPPGNMGPRSGASAPLRLCPGDFDGDEIIGNNDYLRARSCLNQVAVGACAGADMNDDGIVSIHDAVALEIGANACPAPAPATQCAGDMNGDGLISIWDYNPAKSCVGLLAQGNCTYADFDGDGYVANRDLVLLVKAQGTQACSH